MPHRNRQPETSLTSDSASDVARGRLGAKPNYALQVMGADAPTSSELGAALRQALRAMLPGGKIRHEFAPSSTGQNLFASKDPPKLAQLWAGGTALRTPIVYRGDVADVLADITAWSYSDGQTLVDELFHRNIIAAGDVSFEVSLKNDPMLVVATAFFVRSGPVGVLCFRGTEPMSAINWLTDASVEPKPFLSMGLAHGGFSRNLRAVWNDLDHRVNQAIEQEKMKVLYITGHSLGGAMAVVAAATVFADSRYVGWRDLVGGVYTYGQPMVGDAAFAESCESRFGALHFRHVYEHDLVPRMPPRTTGRFEHSGHEYIGSRDGWSPRHRSAVQALSALAVPVGMVAWAFKQFPLTRSIKLPFSIDDHSPNSYLEAFRAQRG